MKPNRSSYIAKADIWCGFPLAFSGLLFEANTFCCQLLKIWLLCVQIKMPIKRFFVGGMIIVGAAAVIESSAQAENLFVVDFGSGNIYEFTPAGVQSIFVSGVGQQEFEGVAFDSAGNLFVPFIGLLGEGPTDIYEFNPNKVQSVFASGVGAAGLDEYPKILAFNKAGDLFVSVSGLDADTDIILRFTPNGVRSTFASGLNEIEGMAFNSAGNLFESDCGSDNIYQFTPTGVRSTFATGLNFPIGLAFDSAGNLFEADWGSGQIYKFTPGGVRSTFASGLNDPTFLAFPPSQTITGAVYCTCDESPIAGASVQIGTNSATSANDGSYSITNILPGTYTATVAATNYTLFTTRVTIPTAQQTQNFTLTPVARLVPLRVPLALANVSANDSIDAPVVPVNDPNALSTAPALGLGVVADDVTPVLFQITAPPGTYTLNLATLDASSSAPVTYSGGSLANNLYILDQNGNRPNSTSITIQQNSAGVNGTNYVYLQGMNWSSFFTVTAPANQVNATLSLSCGGEQVASTSFGIRPPPIALVHGVADNNTTWSPHFLTTLADFRPANFVIPVQYGMGSGTDKNQWPNAIWPLDKLSLSLDAALWSQLEDSPLLAQWAFTRYDVVGHSQGGVLLRMLCQTDNNGNAPFSLANIPIVSPMNYYRGRFRRAITTGSPHNGSLLCWYINQLGETPFWQLQDQWIYTILARFAPVKFDPFGPQIAEINNPHLGVDSRIKFNCIRTSIANGHFPDASHNPPCYSFLGLTDVLPGTGYSRGFSLLPTGSDGVVDYNSEGGGLGTATTTISDNDIAHANVDPIPGVADLFGVALDESQTTDAEVAGQVGLLLNGPANAFGSFQLPTLLSTTIEQSYAALIPGVIIGQSLIIRQPQAHTPSTNENFALQIQTNLPPSGLVNWYAQRFGTNGVSDAGVSLQVNTNDSTLVAVSVADGTQGTIVLYASYSDINGDLVFANPIVIASDTVMASLVGIQLTPPTANMSVGDILPTAIWGNFTNGTSTLLYIPSGQAQYISSATNVASVNVNGTITMVSAGITTITASYLGFTSQTVISTVAPFVTLPSQSVTLIVGSNVTFVATGFGMSELGYQWQLNGTNLTDNGQISGSKSNVLALTNVMVENSGDYHIVLTNMFGAATTSVTLTVTPANPIVSWSSNGPIVYGAALSVAQLNPTANVAGSFAFEPPMGTVLDAGTNGLTTVFTPTDAADYNTVTSTVSQVVLPASLTVTASNVTWIFGQTTPAFTGAITGLTNNDVITATYSTLATSNSPVGTYFITPTLVDPNGRLPDYALTITNGVLNVSFTGSCDAPSSGLVGWWTGDTDASDFFQRLPGILQNGATIGPGFVNGAFDIPPGGYVTIADDALLDPSNSITVEAWINQNAQMGPYDPLVKKTAPSGGGYSLEFAGTGVAAFWVYVSGSGWQGVSGGFVSTNQWTHLAGTYDGANLSVYVDGVLGGSNPVKGPLQTALNALYIGHDSGDIDREYNGVIDEVSIYNRALSAMEVASIYAAGQSGKCRTGFPPDLALQPTNQTVFAGALTQLSVVAGGTPPFAYQWQCGGTNLVDNSQIIGSQNSLLIISNALLSGASNYDVVITNAFGSVTSQVVNLTVIPLVITSQPVNTTAFAGSTPGFSVAVGGSGPFSYNWYFSGTNLVQSGTNSLLSLPGVGFGNAGNYMVVVGNNYGSVTSRVATLTVYYIDQQPISQMGTNGGTVSFDVTMSPPGSYLYQWRFNGINMPTNGIITTLAGNGNSTFSGDGGIAASAALSAPYCTAVDKEGNVYIADRNNNRIRKVSTSGLISTVAGKGGSGYSGDGASATNATLYFPSSVAVDDAGDLFIADYGNNRIRKVDPYGIISTVAGKGIPGFSGDGNKATNAMLYNPSGVVVDSTGNLFIADYSNNRIRKVNANGIITTVAGTGVSGFSGDGDLATSAYFKNPVAISIDAFGDLYIVDYNNYRIRKVDTNGIVGTIAGKGTTGYSGDGGAATNAAMYPAGVAIDHVGNVFIADYSNNRIREVWTSGIITTIAGNGTVVYADGGLATRAGLYSPRGITVDSMGNLFISDSYRIHKIVGNPAYLPTIPQLTVGDLSAFSAGNYSVVIRNASGSITSAVVALTVQSPPIITMQPTSLMVGVGRSANLDVGVVGSGPLSYEWYYSATNLVQSSNSSTIVLDNITPDHAGIYSVVITNEFGCVTSSIALLTVESPPTVTSQPLSQTNVLGTSLSFSVIAGGVGPFNYQWQLNGTNLLNDIITTVVGKGVSSYSGDGGLATDAGLNHPTGLAFNNAGELYIADQANNRIRKVSTNGVITTVVGNNTAGYSGDGGLASNASIDYPQNVSFDSAGNLYIAGYSDDRIRKVDFKGIISTVAGIGSSPYLGDGGWAISAGLSVPTGVGFDVLGNVYVADTGNNRIRKIDHNGIISTVAGNGSKGYGGDGGLASSASLNSPYGVAFDCIGNMFIPDWQNNRVRKVDTNGIISTAAGTGNSGYSGDGGAATNANLNQPQGVTFDHRGNLFIADFLNSRIRMVDTNGIITTVAGKAGGWNFSGDGGAATDANLGGPGYMAFDSSGNMFIPDWQNNRIREVHFAGYPTLTLSNIGISNAGNYSVVIQSPYGSVTSSLATLNVIVPPQIISGGTNFGFMTNQSGNAVGFGFNFSGSAGETIVVDGSTNLLNWTPLFTNTAGTNAAYFVGSSPRQVGEFA